MDTINVVLKTGYKIVKDFSEPLKTMETSGGSESSGGEDADARRSRRGHVLAELLQTERVYVQELGSILSMHSIRRTPTGARSQRAERNAFYTFAKWTPVHIITRALLSAQLCNMKHGKYDLHKSSADLSVGTSYSWYYRKNNSTHRKPKKLMRSASDSTLFSDYNNQINMFEVDRQKSRKCNKSVSDVGKYSRVECQHRLIKTVQMQPFTGNFFYGEPLPGFEDTRKTEEQLTYLPDSDIVTISEDNMTESITTAPTIVEPDQSPELVKNPIYGCRETDVHILTPEYSTDSTVTKDSQLLSNSCTELRKTMDSQNSEDMLGKIMKDYKRIMKEWNNTITEHYSTMTYSKKSTLGRSSDTGNLRKTQSLNRGFSLNNWASPFKNIKNKFRKDKDRYTPTEWECLEAIYDDYDERLQKWCEIGYKEEIEKPENQHMLPTALVGQADVLFGNLHELFTFHQDVFLKDLERSISATELVALCFVEKRETFFRLYSYYCQNIPRSERLRETLVDTHLFLQACQQRLGHKLPLAAYLLKPVQRITKYQLLLKDLLRYSECGSMSAGLQQALDCMLVVLKCVNDSMHQIAITGVPVDLNQQGELLLQGSFLVSSENKRDLRLRIRPRRRHIFLYEKAMLFCKPGTKNSHNKATYHFKHDLQMSQIGLTESVKGDPRKFEVWRQGRSEVHTITAPTTDVKRSWVERIKRVLLDQLHELKGERVRQYAAHHHRTLIQTSSWETGGSAAVARGPHEEPCWSTDPSDDDDEDTDHAPAVGCSLVALSDYTAVGASEVSLREGQHADLLKVGCAGWWYVRLAGGQGEGWAPAAYLDQRKTSRSSSRSHDRLHD
ncbi:hypothetical protein KGM_201520 [Danaus plexippus plexippus]|uniref:Guanine nucleotide exchange factor DBS-like n=1 Tax=Danaus plexippus plexippus TaxID=278856 RepID=A0A212EGQ4_DANPL|nr:hypothetical protein KGM_201520 [Danaus plexippus plexippus]